MADDLLTYYGQDKEEERLLATLGGRLEFERLKMLLARFVPEGARVADVGGGTGRYAEWLASRGCEVELIDPVPLHIEHAQARGVSAAVGDARALPFADASFDAVLLMGPLYHLGERADRLAALHEAARVLRAGGIVAAVAISRFAPLLDMITRHGRIFDESVWANVREELATGRRIPEERRNSLFPDAFFHLPEELVEEVEAGGFAVRGVYAVQGVAWLMAGFEEAWADPVQRERIFDVAALTEDDPHVISASPHLLAVGVKP